MSKFNKVEDQAIMSLIFLAQDEQPSPFVNAYAQHQSKVLVECRHKLKSNTIQLRTLKNTLNQKSAPPTRKVTPREHRYQQSKNKENLKKILEKLQNSPSPSHKMLQKHQRKLVNRTKTQKSQQISVSKQKSIRNRTPKTVKTQLDRLFSKQKDKECIKSLIKDKIIQKLKQTATKRSQFKVCHLASFAEQMAQPSFKRERLATLRTEQTAEKTKYTSLLREQRIFNTSLFSRKNSQINLKKLLF